MNQPECFFGECARPPPFGRSYRFNVFLAWAVNQITFPARRVTVMGVYQPFLHQALGSVLSLLKQDRRKSLYSFSLGTVSPRGHEVGLNFNRLARDLLPYSSLLIASRVANGVSDSLRVEAHGGNGPGELTLSRRGSFGGRRHGSAARKGTRLRKL